MEQTETNCPKPYGQDDLCDFNPEFAVICSFIAQFGSKIDLELNIEELKRSLEDQTTLNESLIDLHVKLLKKIRRYFVRDQWEKALIRYALEYSYDDAYELETLGYLKTRPSIKLQLLRRLLDAQFECDPKFKSSVNLDEANQLRLAPTGRDIKGNTYWHQKDAEGNLRVFQEEPLDYKSWKTICKTSGELKQLLDDLEQIKDEKLKAEPMQEPYHPLTEIFPELFQPKVEDIKPEKPETNKKTNGRAGKRGKGRGRWKKSTTLDPLKEEEENTIDSISRNHDSNDGQEFKPLPQESMDSQSSTIVPTQCSSPDDMSIESQVSRTMKNLLDKVVTTCEFILKPLSRNLTNNDVEPNLAGIPNELKTKPRKRQPKREKPQPDLLPRRSSSRIQQLQLKKEEEVKKSIDSKTSKSVSLDQESSNGSSRNHKNNLKEESESPEPETKKGRQRKRKDRQRWRHGKGKKKLSWDKDDSDLSSTSSLTESNDDEEDDLDLSNEKLDYDNNNDDDDEFACEEEETNNEPVIIKRARTARQVIEEPDETGELNTSSILEEDKPCGRCDKSNDPEWILLCDMCDDGYHTSCCLPPLMYVPDGDWFCPFCEHKTLLINLKEFYDSIIEIEEANERERLRRQKSRKKPVKKDLIDEITVAEGQLSGKRQRDSLPELNDPIALQQLDEEISENELPTNYRERSSKPKKPNRKRRSYDDDDFDLSYGRRKQKKSRRRQRSESGESDDGPSSDQFSVSSEDRPKVRKARACVSYQFKEYDEMIETAIKHDTGPEAPVADEYDDDDVEEENEPETPEGGNYGRGKDMATIEALAYQQENGLIIQADTEPASVDGHVGSIDQSKSGSGVKNRKKGRRLNDLDADSEIDSATSDESFQASSATEEEEEDEEDDETEVETEDDSSFDEILTSNYRKSKRKKKSGNRKRRRRRSESYESEDDYEPRSRRRASNRVSYKESSDEDDDDFLVERKKRKKTILSSDEESQASWKGSPKSDVEDDDDNEGAKKLDEDESTSFTESLDEIISDAVTNPSQEKVKEPMREPEAQIPVHTKSPEHDEIPPNVKRVRLEKRETRPVYNADLMNESIDEITVPTAPQKQLAPRATTSKGPRAPRRKKQPAPAPSSPVRAPAAMIDQPIVEAPTASAATATPSGTGAAASPVGTPSVVASTTCPPVPVEIPRPCTPPLSMNRQLTPMVPHPSMVPRPTGPPPPPGQVSYPPPPHGYHLSPMSGPPHQPYMTHHMYPPPPSPYGLPHGYPHSHPPPPPPHQTHMGPLPTHHSPYPPPPPNPYHQYNPYMSPNGPYMAPQPILRASPPVPPPPHQMMRSSINDLNQYCNGPAYPSSIFSSFNMSMPPKSQSPVHPPFYEENEVRPPKAVTTKGKQKTGQKTA